MAKLYIRSDDVVERKVRESRILVPIKTGPARLDALYTLNTTAGFIWDQLSSGVSEDELVSRLLAEYEVNEQTTRNDVRRILDGLAGIGALQITEQEP